MTASVKSARHRASGRPSTPIDPVLSTFEGVGRKTAVVVASSGLVVAASAAPASANEAQVASIDTGVTASTSAIIGAASLGSVPVGASWSLDVPDITVTAPEPPKPKAAQATTKAVKAADQPKADTPAAEAKPTAAPKKVKAKTASLAVEGIIGVATTVKAVKPKADDSTAGDDSDKVMGSAVIEVASRYIGVPYRYGGSSPRGFDCSGFTQYVYGQLGIKLSHYSESQPSKGRVVSRSDAQPGDLIYTPGHVAIYAGGNKMIDSARTGTTVQFRKMWQRNPTFIRLVG